MPRDPDPHRWPLEVDVRFEALRLRCERCGASVDCPAELDEEGDVICAGTEAWIEEHLDAAGDRGPVRASMGVVIGGGPTQWTPIGVFRFRDDHSGEVEYLPIAEFAEAN